MRKSGRPRKSALERRSAQITVCLKLDEAAQLDLFAEEAGSSVSEYVRNRLLADRPAPALAPALKHDLYRLLLSVQRGLRDGLAPSSLAERMQAVIDRLQE